VWVGVLEIALAVPAISLKEKRGVVRRVVSRTRNEFNVSVAEVDELDNPGAAVIGVVSVSGDRRYLEGQLMKLEDFVDRLEVAEITDSHRSFEHF
jgi:uncharacterized protein YlxP (DUF503 family)